MRTSGWMWRPELGLGGPGLAAGARIRPDVAALAVGRGGQSADPVAEVERAVAVVSARGGSRCVRGHAGDCR
ncbi:hypothetical protein GCM10027360_16430 [Amycolatopsis echigonensis]